MWITNSYEADFFLVFANASVTPVYSLRIP